MMLTSHDIEGQVIKAERMARIRKSPKRKEFESMFDELLVPPPDTIENLRGPQMPFSN